MIYTESFQDKIIDREIRLDYTIRYGETHEERKEAIQAKYDLRAKYPEILVD